MQVAEIIEHGVFTRDLQVGDRVVIQFEADGTPKRAVTIKSIDEWDEDVWNLTWHEGGGSGTCVGDERWYLVDQKEAVA